MQYRGSGTPAPNRYPRPLVAGRAEQEHLETMTQPPEQTNSTDHTDHNADRNIWPLFTSHDALGLRDWLTQLGFVKGILVAEGEFVQHSEMLWPEGGRLMVCSARPGDQNLQPVGVGNIYVVTDHPEQVHTRAVAADFRISQPFHTTDFGSRTFGTTTPEGHSVSFGTYAGEDLSLES